MVKRRPARVEQLGANPGTVVLDARDIVGRAAEAQPIDDWGAIDTLDIPETDFAIPGAVRGRYYELFRAAVLEDPPAHHGDDSRPGGRARDER
jgi:hypothetical protein